MSNKRKKRGRPKVSDGESVEDFLARQFEGAGDQETVFVAVENPLAIKLKARIERQGPLTLHDYMQACLADPDYGYYISRDPFGAGGDFITAPDICQIFGELLGLWCVHVWAELGQPSGCKLIELGPGRGALMSDALRAASLVPAFLQSIEVHFVETSLSLRTAQEERIRADAQDHGRELPELFWHDRLEDVPNGPTLLIANEFLDALPIRQYQFKNGQWFERLIGLDEKGGFCFLLASQPNMDPDLSGAVKSEPVEGDFLEICPARAKLIQKFATRAKPHPVAGLFIDYGYSEPAFGDSFQAIKDHQFADPLLEPGLADVTAHVDFAALAETASELDLDIAGPISQRDFFIALGVRERAAQLMQAQENMMGASQFMAGLQRLIDPDQMGSLFKVVAFAGSAQPKVPGFEGPESNKESYLG